MLTKNVYNDTFNKTKINIFSYNLVHFKLGNIKLKVPKWVKGEQFLLGIDKYQIGQDKYMYEHKQKNMSIGNWEMLT